MDKNNSWKDKMGFDIDEYLKQFGFEEKKITEKQNNLISFNQLKFFDNPWNIYLNASISATTNDDGKTLSFLYCVDFECTVVVRGYEIHIGCYDMIIGKENKDIISFAIRDIISIMKSTAQLYVATQTILKEKAN